MSKITKVLLLVEFVVNFTGKRQVRREIFTSYSFLPAAFWKLFKLTQVVVLIYKLHHGSPVISGFQIVS